MNLRLITVARAHPALLRATLTTLACTLLIAGCGSGGSDAIVGEPVSAAIAVSSQPAMMAQIRFSASGPTTKAVGNNLLDLSGQWQNWAGSGSTVSFDQTLGALLIPASQSGNDMVLGVRRYNEPLASGRSYTLSVEADNTAAAAVLFLFDADGKIVPVPDTPDGQLRFARTGEPLTFSSPGNVAGFYLQVQNQWKAPAQTILSAELAADDGSNGGPGSGDGPNLINTMGDWPDWFGRSSGITADGAGVNIPPPDNGTGNRIGVQRFATSLTAGGRYELTMPVANDPQAAALLFLIDASGGIIEFADAATGIRAPWLATSTEVRKQFVAPGNVASFAIQVQSGWLATSSARIAPALRLAGGKPPCVLVVEQPSISFGPAEPSGVFEIDLTGGEGTVCE